MKKTLLIVLLFFIFQIKHTLAQNEKFKALFMYNFTKYLEWPEPDRKGDFIITVIGESKIVDELHVIARKKKIGFQPIVVKKATNPNNIDKSHIVYIAKSKSRDLAIIKEKLASLNTVIITDTPDAISKGAGINYIVQNGKQLFEIRKENIEEHNVRVGSDLLLLGVQK